MAKDKTIFTCTDCGGTTPRWLGKCPACGAWNTLIESTVDAGGNAKNRYTSQFQALAKTSELTKLGDIEATDVDRSPTGIEELDRALGGGVVEGGVVLIGGDPGIGKSTLLLQALDALQRKGMNTLYVTGEESGAQVALRSRRLGLDNSQVQVLAEIQLEKILATLQTERPHIAVIDSIQTVYSDQLTSAPGSVAQVRECAAHLTRAAKATGTAIVLVGHVTKEGALAGPRVLEHMVDTVLYFEGDTHSSFRLIRGHQKPLWCGQRDWRFCHDRKRLEGRFQSQRHLFVTAFRTCGRQLCHGHFGRHSAFVGRNSSPGRQRRAQPTQAVCGPRKRPFGHALGRLAPARWRGLHGPRCIRQCGGRRSNQ